MSLNKEDIGQIKSRAALDDYVSWIGGDKRRFSQLIKIMCCGEAPFNDKASWVMVHVIEKHPHLLKPYRDKLLDYLEHPGTQIMLKRHIIKAYCYSELPQKRLGLLTDACMSYLSTPSESKALRIYSMNLLEKIIRIHPALKEEFLLILHETQKEQAAWLNIKANRILNRERKATFGS